MAQHILALVAAPSQEQRVLTLVTALVTALVMSSAVQVVRAQKTYQVHAVAAVTLLGATNQEAVVVPQEA